MSTPIFQKRHEDTRPDECEVITPSTNFVYLGLKHDAQREVKRAEPMPAHWTFEYKVNGPGSEYRIVSNNGYSSFWNSVAKVTVDVAIKKVHRVLEELRFYRVEDDTVFDEIVSLYPAGLPRQVEPSKIASVCNALSSAGILTLDIVRLRKEWSTAYKSEVARNNSKPLRIRGSAAALLLHTHQSLHLPGEKMSVHTATAVLSGVASEPHIVQDTEFVEALDILVRGSCKAAKLRTEPV